MSLCAGIASMCITVYVLYVLVGMTLSVSIVGICRYLQANLIYTIYIPAHTDTYLHILTCLHIVAQYWMSVCCRYLFLYTYKYFTYFFIYLPWHTYWQAHWWCVAWSPAITSSLIMVAASTMSCYKNAPAVNTGRYRVGQRAPIVLPINIYPTVRASTV